MYGSYPLLLSSPSPLIALVSVNSISRENPFPSHHFPLKTCLAAVETVIVARAAPAAAARKQTCSMSISFANFANLLYTMK